MSLTLWTVLHAAQALLWLWILRWGGAAYLEGTLLSGFLVSTFAPRWSADGLRMAALILLMFCAVSFVVGLFVPSLRCWVGGAC